MLNTLTFKRLEDNSRNGYDIYYAIPREQRSLHCGLMKTIFIVTYDDDIVFVCNHDRSQHAGLQKCREWIDKQLEDRKKD